MNHREFEREIRTICHRHQLWQVLADFCEMSALSFANVVHKNPEREARYLALVGRYRPEEQAVFPRLLGITALALERGDCDFLGQAFMQLELGSHWDGQFFTPFALCRTMAAAALDADHLAGLIAERGFVSVLEPASGAGAMAIAAALHIREAGFNPQTQLHVTAVDKDRTAAHMSFIQLSLLGIPAVVSIGDSLSGRHQEAFHTPAHLLGFWDRKLRRGYALGSSADTASEPAAPMPGPVVAAAAMRQLALFSEAA